MRCCSQVIAGAVMWFAWAAAMIVSHRCFVPGLPCSAVIKHLPARRVCMGLFGLAKVELMHVAGNKGIASDRC